MSDIERALRIFEVYDDRQRRAFLNLVLEAIDPEKLKGLVAAQPIVIAADGTIRWYYN